MPIHRRNICFVTGTRAEFGLMRSVLESIKEDPRLRLQLIVTGMHLSKSHGRSIDGIRAAGWKVDAVAPWSGKTLAEQTGRAMAGIGAAIEKLESEVVLVVGDRVEAFAAASAGHVAGKVVAHVHGGDRALGQIDDSLRHAITKLSHLHFPATKQSAGRIKRMGEDARRIILAGSPGVDGIELAAAKWNEVEADFPGIAKGRYALLVLHPADGAPAVEKIRSITVLSAVLAGAGEKVVIVYPNNDPGSEGIIEAWERINDKRVTVRRDIARPMFLGLMRDAAMLVGNSSAGIIEAASFGTPVIDIGPRQTGRERGGNVVHLNYEASKIMRAVADIWRDGKPRRFTGRNVYGQGGAGRIIADTLAKVVINDRLLRKLIAY